MSIAVFQAVDPGSIPGRRSDCFFWFDSGDNCENSILRCWAFFVLSSFLFVCLFVCLFFSFFLVFLLLLDKQTNVN